MTLSLQAPCDVVSAGTIQVLDALFQLQQTALKSCDYFASRRSFLASLSDLLPDLCHQSLGFLSQFTSLAFVPGSSFVLGSLEQLGDFPLQLGQFTFVSRSPYDCNEDQ